MTILYDSTNMSRLVTILWYNLIQFYKSQTCLDLSQAIRWWNTLKFEQMADEMFHDKAIPWIAASKWSDQKSCSSYVMGLKLAFLR